MESTKAVLLLLAIQTAAGEPTALDASERWATNIGDLASGLQMVVKGFTKAVMLGAGYPTRNVGVVRQDPYGCRIRAVSMRRRPKRKYSGFQL